MFTLSELILPINVMCAIAFWRHASYAFEHKANTVGWGFIFVSALNAAAAAHTLS
jgi:hypothetical protein